MLSTGTGKSAPGPAPHAGSILGDSLPFRRRRPAIFQDLQADLFGQSNARQEIALHLGRTLLLSHAPGGAAQSSPNIAQCTGIDLADRVGCHKSDPCLAA
jgi:hypothetical protein